jgi:putative thioredoxin
MIIEVNESNIQQELVTNSLDKNVFFYVYDATNDLLPHVTATLENLVTAESTQVVLAKGNVHSPIIQSICSQLGITSAPAMCIFQKGQPVVILNSQQLQMTDKLAEALQDFLPSEEDKILSQVNSLIAEGKNQEAFDAISIAYQKDENNFNYQLNYINLAIKINNLTAAKEALDKISPANQQTQEYKIVLSAYTLAVENLNNPETKILEDKYAQNPDDFETAIQLSTTLSQSNQHEKALNILYQILAKDLNALDGTVKKTYLDIVSTTTAPDVQAKFRRKLYSLLH